MSEQEIRPQAIETAWKLHDAQIAWTSQVDSKASFVLAVETGVTAGVVTLAGDGHRLSHLHGWLTVTCFAIGLAALVIAIVCVCFVVRPRLHARQTKADSAVHFIYFGHARHWSADDLAGELTGCDLLSQLSQQIVRMADIAWLKHRLLQVSLTAAMLGSALVGVAAALNSR